MLKRNMLLLLCVPVLAFGIGACGSDDDESGSTADSTAVEASTGATDTTDQGMNIVETAQATSDLSTLVDAVVAADLVTTLEGEGPFTVFAPTNDAFAALPPAELKRLLKPANQEELASILTYHVAAGDVKAADLSDGQMIETVNGDTLEVKIDGDKVMVGDATVAQADIETSNGTVHVIDSVLLPQ
ncbi:MAG: fasciclin domain-containing protein [Solirubrobacterales bacterium]